MTLEMKDFDQMDDLIGKSVRVTHVDGESICNRLAEISPLTSADFVVKEGDKDYHRLTGRWFVFNNWDQVFVWEGSTIEVEENEATPDSKFEPWPKKEVP